MRPARKKPWPKPSTFDSWRNPCPARPCGTPGRGTPRIPWASLARIQQRTHPVPAAKPALPNRYFGNHPERNFYRRKASRHLRHREKKFAGMIFFFPFLSKFILVSKQGVPLWENSSKSSGLSPSSCFLSFRFTTSSNPVLWTRTPQTD